MGSITFDFLADSFLFDEAFISEEYHSISDDDIYKELQNYREHCKSHLQNLIDDIRGNETVLRVFRGEDRRLTLVQLKQSAFYLDQYILDDPLFKLTTPVSKNKKLMTAYLGFKPDKIDKSDLAKTVNFVKQLTPMVAANFVRIVPVSYFFELPESIPLRYSENAFADALPEHLMSFLRARVLVGCVKEAPEGMILENNLYPSRHIHVQFKGDNFGKAMMFQLLKIAKAAPLEHGGSVFGIHMLKTSDIPDVNYFEHWVKQSINSAAAQKYNQLTAENILAADLRATYVTTSELDFELLQQIVPERDATNNFAVNAVMNLNLPSFENINIENLMKIRTEEHDAFRNFRSELNKKLLPLRAITDSDNLKIAVENLNQEFSEFHVRKLDGIIRDLHKKIFCDAALIVSSLIASTHAGGYGIPLVASAIANGMKSIQEYRSKRKDNPLFFLWKLQKSERK